MLRRVMVTEIRIGSLKPTQIASRMSPQASVAWNTGKSGDDQGSFRTAMMMIPRDSVDLGTKLCTRLLIKVGLEIEDIIRLNLRGVPNFSFAQIIISTPT